MMDLRNRNHHSSSSSGSGFFQRGFNLKAVLEDREEPIPLSNIPSDVNFEFLRQLLIHSKIELKKGEVWDNVEFYLDEHFFFPLEDSMTLSQAKMENGQTLYLAYRKKTQTTQGKPLTVVIPLRRRPLILKDLPPWATIGGLKKLLVSICEPNEVNLKNFWLRRESDDRDLAIPEGVRLSKLNTDHLVVESDVGSWEELQQKPKPISPWFWLAIALLLVVLAVGMAEVVLYVHWHALGTVLGKIRKAGGMAAALP